MLVSLAEEKEFCGVGPGLRRDASVARQGSLKCGMGFFHLGPRLGCRIALKIVSLVSVPVDAIMRLRYEVHVSKPGTDRQRLASAGFEGTRIRSDWTPLPPRQPRAKSW